MVKDKRSRVHRIAIEAASVITCIAVNLKRGGKGVKSSRSETIFRDIGQGSHGAGMSHTQEIEIIRMIPVGCQHRDSIQS